MCKRAFFGVSRGDFCVCSGNFGGNNHLSPPFEKSMSETLHVICLRTTRYSDRHAILSAYSLERGAVSLLVPEGRSRGAVRVRALTMPLSIGECEVDVRPGRSVYNFHDLRPLTALSGLRGNPMKGAVAHFLAEVVSGVLREGQPDRAMYEYVARSIVLFDGMATRVAVDFHLWFLYRLAVVAGVAPDVSTWREGRYFDMADGVFRVSPPLHTHYLSPDESRVVALMDRVSYRAMRCLGLNHTQRNRMLDVALEYFGMHYPGVSSLKSLDVLRTLF